MAERLEFNIIPDQEFLMQMTDDELETFKASSDGYPLGYEYRSLDKPFRYFSIDRTLDSLPACKPCSLCSKPTSKTEIPYFVEGENVIAIDEKAPAYECFTPGGCGGAFSDSQTAIQLLTGASNVLDKGVDAKLINQLNSHAKAIEVDIFRAT